MESPEGFNDFFKVMSSFSGVLSDIELKRREIIQDLVTAKGKLFPKKLYHYTNLKGISGIIQSNHLWATHFRFLNDATELLYGADQLANELEKYGEDYGGDISNLLNKLSNYYKEHGESYRNFFETYIISLSEDSDVLSQWRAYSDQAIGCCLEFDLSDSRLFAIVSENTPWALEVLPVIYDESDQRALIRSGIEKLLYYLNSTGLTAEKIVKSSEMEQAVVLGFLMHAFEPFVTAFKNPGFSEEREWRAIASCPSHQTETKKKERFTEFGSSYYLECIFLQEDKEKFWQRKLLPITGIKHGPLAKEKAKDQIKRLLLLNGYENQVVLSDSRIPLKK